MSDDAVRSIGQAVRGADRGFRVIDGGPPEQPGPPDDDPEACPVIALGHLAGVLHFLDVRGQKRDLTARQLGSRHELLMLFGGDDAWLRSAHPKRIQQVREDGGKEWVVVDFSINKAAAALQHACFQAGLFGDHLALRRAGVWPGPDDKPAVHCGDQVLLAETWHPAGLRRGNQIWVASPPTARPASPCPVAVGLDLQQRLRDYWNWTQPGGPIAVMGLMANAYFGASVTWRPAGFVTGGTGSGKTALQRVLRAVLPVHHYDNDTTKAGLEQAIDGRAMACIVDEAADRADRDSARRLVDLVLSATGDEGTKGSRGTADGRGRRIEVSGSIIMFSINPPELEPQHFGRFAMIELQRPAAGADHRLQHRATAEFARAHGPMLWGRALGAFERYHRVLEQFRVRLGEIGCASREMDQIGALIAGWWILTHEGLPDERGLREGVGAMEGFVRLADEVQAEDRPQRAVQHLMASLATLHRSTERETIGRLLDIAWGTAETMMEPASAVEVLERHGVRAIRATQVADRRGIPVPRMADGDGAWFMNSNPELAKLFAGTPWDGSRWLYELRRLETARRSGKSVRCGSTTGHALWLSRADLLPEDNQKTE